jgi:MoxR-like ATPase
MMREDGTQAAGEVEVRGKDWEGTHIAGLVETMDEARKQVAKVIVGQDEVIDFAMIALLCEGHVLFEGVPGLGKTLLVRTLAEALDISFARIQFTPDLMPADVIGTTMISQSKDEAFDLKFEPGPVFANLVLADEINRASPKTQSALLEAMQERSVTVRGKRHLLPRPFQVLATQNPLEMEGTYPLPEAQIDRFFFKILVRHPDVDELVRIVDRTVGADVPSASPVMKGEDLLAIQKAVREVVVPPHLVQFAARLVLATQPERVEANPDVRRLVRFGAGPRGAQTLILAAKARALLGGRLNASMDDVMACVTPSLRHRIALNFDGQSEGVKIDSLLNDVVAAVARDSGGHEVLKNG